MGTQDDIYGENGREEEYSYDPQLVLDSTTANVLQKYAAAPMTSEEILAKRNLATVKCPQPFQIPKCKPACVFNVETDPCEQFDLTNVL